jgi:hypothetical protein
MSEWEESKDEVEFARAILRKAQEKWTHTKRGQIILLTFLSTH